jgi:hypothetical protein
MWISGGETHWQIRTGDGLRMSLQDHNAGNAGDQLKHALLSELLIRLPRDESWGYAETHAGAGAYAAPHAGILMRGARKAVAGEAGSTYAQLLELWQRSPGAHAGQGVVRYPGSPALAALSGKIRGEMVLAESDAESLGRLRDALDRGAGFGNLALRLLEGSFEGHLGALTSASRLLILVDPYYYQSDADEGTGGRLGRLHLEQLVTALSGRDAVLMIFCANRPREQARAGPVDEAAGGRPAGDPMRGSRGTWRSLGADLAGLDPPSLRLFRAAGTPHALLAAGWGQGRSLVARLPGAARWERSWLARPPLALRIVEETPAAGGRLDRPAGGLRQEGNLV